MSGTNSGWGTMPNPAGMAGYGGAGDASSLYANAALANMTPEQQQQYRQRMYAQALMGQSSSAPQRSGWGAMSNAASPILGAAMMMGSRPGGFWGQAAGPGASNLPAAPGMYAPM